MLTQCLLQLGRAKEAKKIITEAIGKGLRHPLAEELLKQARSGHKQKAGKPVPLKDALHQIEALFQTGRYAEVEALGRELQRRHARVPRLDYLIGSSALVQGRLQDALQPLRRAVEFDGVRSKDGAGLVQSRLRAGGTEPSGRVAGGLSAGGRRVPTIA